MFKKLGIVALVIGAAVFTISKLDMGWHFKHHLKNAKDELRSRIPTEEKILRLKDEIAKLKPEKGKHIAVIANELYKIEKQEKDIVAVQANLEKWATDIKTLKAALKDEHTLFITLGGEKHSRKDVERSLTKRWEDFKTAEAALASQKDIVSTSKEKVESAQSKLRAMDAKEKEMLAKLQRLEIELAKLREAQVQNDVVIDDGQFSKVVKLFQEIEDQIGKEKKVLELQKGVSTDVKLEEALNLEARTEKALKEMDERFGETNVADKRK